VGRKELTEALLWDLAGPRPVMLRGYGLTAGVPPCWLGVAPGIVAERDQESSPPTLPDDLGRLEEEGWGNGQAQRLGGLEVDDELKGRGLLDRQVGGLGPLQDLVHVRGDALPLLGRTWPIGPSNTVAAIPPNRTYLIAKKEFLASP
jgi:hypothetical protein